MNGILTENLKGVLVEKQFPNFVQQINKKYESESFFMQAKFIVSLLQAILTH